jgi:hypothetical protein
MVTNDSASLVRVTEFTQPQFHSTAHSGWYSAIGKTMHDMTEDAASWLFQEDDNKRQSKVNPNETKSGRCLHTSVELPSAEEFVHASKESSEQRSRTCGFGVGLRCMSKDACIDIIPSQDYDPDSSHMYDEEGYQSPQSCPTQSSQHCCDGKHKLPNVTQNTNSKLSKTQKWTASRARAQLLVAETDWARESCLRGNRSLPDPFETSLASFGLYDHRNSTSMKPGTTEAAQASPPSGADMLSEMDWVRLLGNQYKAPQFVVVQTKHTQHFISGMSTPAPAANSTKKPKNKNDTSASIRLSNCNP